MTAELAKCLTRLGHDVTVFATGDSSPAGRLLWRFPRAVWPPDDHAELRHAAFAWRHIVANAPDVDVVHVHQAQSLALASLQPLPVVATIHHERDAKLVDFYGDFPDVTYVAISQRQAELSPELRARHVVHHGLDPQLYPLGEGRGGYVAFLGRLAPQKAPHVAIDAAIAAGVPLRIGGEAHWVAREYFEREVKPRLANPLITHLGEVSHAPKLELLGGARALLFPIEWEEPFGLVMIESMLCGTPVIAFPHGSAPEVVDDGVTGWIADTEDDMVARLRALRDGDLAFDRRLCREQAVRRFGMDRMVDDYLAVYQSAIGMRPYPAFTPEL